MREIQASVLTDAIRDLAIEANCVLPADMQARIEQARRDEPFETAQGILDKIIENYGIAKANTVPICQDTGMACVFVTDLLVGWIEKLTVRVSDFGFNYAVELIEELLRSPEAAAGEVDFFHKLSKSRSGIRLMTGSSYG